MIVSVHSFKGGTGKTFVSLNLSYLLSKRFKVCLIDFDFRAPSLHIFFDGRKYVNELLEGKAKLDECLVTVSRNLSVMLASPKLEDIRKDLRRSDREEMRILERMIALKPELERFDFVLLDTSPGLSYRSINALLISDLILLVARADKLDLNGLKTLLKVIENVKARKYVVLNRVVGEVEFDSDVIAKIPCSCDVSMDHPFFVERFPDHIVTKAIETLAERICSLLR